MFVILLQSNVRRNVFEKFAACSSAFPQMNFFCLQMNCVTDFSCNPFLLLSFPSLMSSRSRPSCLYPTVLDNVTPFLWYLDEIYPLIFHWNLQGSFKRSQGANGENAFSDSSGKMRFLLIFRVKKKNELIMLLFWHWILIQRLKIYKNSQLKLVAAWSVRLFGNHQSQAARRAVSTWIGDRLANIHL